MKYNIAFSLNREITVKASTYEEAEKMLRNQLELEGVNLELYQLEEFDVEEEEDE